MDDQPQLPDPRPEPPPGAWYSPFARGAQSGARNEQHNYFGTAARPPVHWPCQVGLLPQLADCYQVRDDLAATLDTALASAPTAVLGQVLSGMGGVGKTQAATAYARRRWDTGAVDALVWITAASRDAIITGYAQAGHDLNASTSDDPERAASQFLSWLAGTPRRWLIVLDDLANPAHLRNLWPPPNPHGQVLVTTRRRDAALHGHGRTVIDVGLFTPDQAVRYLTHKLAPGDLDNQPPPEAGELAKDLGYLPLALAQAAAYIRDL